MMTAIASGVPITVVNWIQIATVIGVVGPVLFFIYRQGQKVGETREAAISTRHAVDKLSKQLSAIDGRVDRNVLDIARVTNSLQLHREYEHIPHQH